MNDKSKNQRGKRGGGKGRSNFSKRQRDIESVDMAGQKKLADDTGRILGSNDPRWYAFNDSLLRDSSSFSYSAPVGGQLNTGITSLDANSIPGIMTFYCSPSFGKSLEPMSPLNTAARNIYSFVRHANSGSRNYDSTDLMLYLCAMDSAYSLTSYMKRLYGVLNLYTYQNRYYPAAVAYAMRVDFTDFISHLADFRAFINSYAVRIGSMCIPSSMSYMARHMWMYSELYVDSNTEKAQTYFYNPHAFYKYSLDVNGAGMLQYTPMTAAEDHNMTFAELRDYALALIAPILASEDCNIMSGDILKAFSADGVFKVTGINEVYQCFPIYNTEVMSQFENLTMVGYPPTAQINNTDPTKSKGTNVFQIITPSSNDGLEGWLYYRCEQRTPDYIPAGMTGEIAADITSGITSNRIVNFHHNSPTPADAMVATRLTNVSTGFVNVTNPSGTTGNGYFVDTVGSDVCHSCIIFKYSMVNNNWVLEPTSLLYTVLPLTVQNIATADNSAINTNTTYDDWNSVYTAGGAAEEVFDALNKQFGNLIAANASAAVAYLSLLNYISQFDWHPEIGRAHV